MGSSLASHPSVDKVAFTGSTPIGQLLRKTTAGSGKKISLELGGKSPVLVYESADLDSVVEGEASLGVRFRVLTLPFTSKSDRSDLLTYPYLLFFP